MLAYNKFREIFWDAFHRPDLKSEKFENSFLIELQPLNDLLAGPLFSIYENAQCDYIFDKERFPGIKDQDDFLNWCIDIINKYKELISSNIPDTDVEKKDQQILLYQTDMMMELADLAYKIINKSR